MEINILGKKLVKLSLVVSQREILGETCFKNVLKLVQTPIFLAVFFLSFWNSWKNKLKIIKLVKYFRHSIIETNKNTQDFTF